MKKNSILCILFLSTFAQADEGRFIAVSGEGEIKVKPDIAQIDLQVNTFAKDAKAAQEKNAQEMNRLQKLLTTDFSVAAKDIQTTGFQVNPEYRYENNGKQIFIGYRVFHSLSVTYRNLEKVGGLLDRLSTKGSDGNGVSYSGISFDTEKRKEIELQSLNLAMTNAELRADALAKFAKVSIKRVRKISESNTSYQAFRPMAGAMLQAEKAAADTTTPIASGEIKVNSSVAVEFEIN